MLSVMGTGKSLPEGDVCRMAVEPQEFFVRNFWSVEECCHGE
jgi:hypothetical protein